MKYCRLFIKRILKVKNVLIHKPLILGLATLFFYNGIAQKTNQKLYAKYLSGVIELDGELSEPIWQVAQKLQTFGNIFPQIVLRQNIKQLSKLHTMKTLYM